ncbi:MAG TPA: hypothetical protein VES68_00585 [Candidatus Sulfotelmatobacter sp.]|nr:hypothetical protein [Candidatus Sulfotelmatobacter sp.]
MEISITKSKKITLNADSTKSFFREYRDFIFPSIVILGSFLVLFLVVIPQLNQYFDSSKKLSDETQKLNLLKNNYNFLSNLDENKTNADLKILSKVLPPNKDFTGILNAISLVSSKTNVSIGNFSFSLGDLSKVYQEGNLTAPSIKIEVNLGGNAQSIVKFMNELNKTAPLSQTSIIKGSGELYLLTISFYYKPFPPQNISDDEAVAPLSSQNNSFLKDIYSWNNTSDQDAFSFLPAVNTSTSSASNPSPF